VLGHSDGDNWEGWASPDEFLLVFPILYYNAACCHRRGSVHGLSVRGSVCHDRGTRLGTSNREGGPNHPWEWAILRERGAAHWTEDLIQCL